MHRFILSAALLLAASASFSYAVPADISVPADAMESNNITARGPDPWGCFCDDSDCSENCGEWVSLTDPGCLNEGGRGSFYVKDGGDGTHYMIVSPSADCPCQSDCDDGADQGFRKGDTCHTLNPDNQSYRFIKGGDDGCPDNEC
ncbi:hypothetical protein N7456_000094 [Penicillium angulare]|uniref:Uncharacterized protein n=1 Tax=Penicillium angulare TaxID=116970 RepID=A0A9W9GBX2_9EURO|nr:hypothetical protein N7456_000094 [Penicillium angulare]